MPPQKYSTARLGSRRAPTGLPVGFVVPDAQVPYSFEGKRVHDRRRHGQVHLQELHALDHRAFERVAIVERYLNSAVIHRVIMSSTGDEDDIA